MKDWTPERVAAEAGARLVQPPPADAAGPGRLVIDSREAGPGDLFVGLRGEHDDGGRFAPQALSAGAWGVLVGPEAAKAAGDAGPGVRLAADDPLAALQRLASAWREALGAQVIAVTGSTGKTSTKDILGALLAPHRATTASPANYNTEIGLPLAMLGAPPGTEVMVLEMGMRGPAQIAELTAVARPDVGVIVNVGPVHLELMGSLEAIAAAKGELIRDMPAGGTAVVPAGETLLEPHLRDDVEIVTFGEGGDVHFAQAEGDHAVIAARGERVELDLPYAQAHHRLNTLAAVAAAQAIGVAPSGRIEVPFSALRGERIDLPNGVAVVNDCYNANPMSMRAALEELAVTAPGRRVAVLGDMLELGEDEREFHREAGATAGERGVDLLVTVGPLAAAMLERYEGEGIAVADAAEAASILPELLEPGDTVLVKGSRAVGLEAVAEALAEDAGPSPSAGAGG
jgi:UDP-N-acetylmuramoyl-tripeptide--D-alanyl-D-alanine ligase